MDTETTTTELEDLIFPPESEETEDKGKAENETATVSNPEDTPDSIELPEKFQGKSMEDIIKSYQELEKEFGRKNNELGELRKLTDSILQQQLSAPQSASQFETPDPEIEFDDLINQPKEVIRTVLETDPEIQAIKQELAAVKRNESLARLREQHPDADKLVVDPAFQAWVTASPARQRMFQEANSNFDADLAAELFSMYKLAQQAGKQATEQMREEAADKAVADAKLETGRTSTQANSSKPILSRAELIRLRIEDPQRFQAMEPQIMEAYSEGRVR